LLLDLLLGEPCQSETIYIYCMLTWCAVEGEGSVGVIGVADPDVIDGLGVLQPLLDGIVRQPDLVPLVDAVEVRGVVQAHIALWYGAQVLRTKRL
jgi:hypothetical protein